MESSASKSVLKLGGLLAVAGRGLNVDVVIQVISSGDISVTPSPPFHHDHDHDALILTRPSKPNTIFEHGANKT